MKLMVIGSDKVFAIENAYVKYIREADTDVTAFNAQSIFYDYYQQSFLNKVFFKTGLSPVLPKINRLFKESVNKFNPDVIWVFKGMEIFPKSLEWAKQKGIRLVNYNPDNPFLFTGKGSGNKNVTNSISLYDLHFTYNLHIQQQLQQQFAVSTAYLPFGFDISEKIYQEASVQEETIKACFLGNPDKQRGAFLMSLAEQGVKLDLFGNNWNRFVHHANLHEHGPVYGDELWKVLRRYRVQLNIMRVHNEDSHNMRTFEIPAIGGIMLAPDTNEHRLFFQNGSEAFLFKNVRDCADQVNALLALPASQAMEIRNRARIRSLTSGYSYKDRALFALKTMQDLCA